MVVIDGLADFELLPLGPLDRSVGAGTLNEYTFRPRNLGPLSAESIAITLTASPGVQLQPASGVRWTCATELVCTYEHLRSGELGYSLIVPALMPQQPGVVQITATATTATEDPVGGNNIVTYSSTITP